VGGNIAGCEAGGRTARVNEILLSRLRFEDLGRSKPEWLCKVSIRFEIRMQVLMMQHRKIAIKLLRSRQA